MTPWTLLLLLFLCLLVALVLLECDHVAIVALSMALATERGVRNPVPRRFCWGPIILLCRDGFIIRYPEPPTPRLQAPPSPALVDLPRRRRWLGPCKRLIPPVTWSP